IVCSDAGSALHVMLVGVPVAGVQKTTIRTFMVEGEEKNEGLRPHIRWTKIPDFVHVYCGISPMNRVYFPTSAVCLARPPKLGESFKKANKHNYFQRIVVFCPKTTGTPRSTPRLSSGCSDR